MSVGSSPPARGLLIPLHGGPWRWRLIPACAGTTKRPLGCGSTMEAHPRLRGDYLISSLTRLCTVGSSPPARGLPDDSEFRRFYTRLIPACAGTTIAYTAFFRSCKAHPRLRGDYHILRMSAVHTWGSSPPARGLLNLLLWILESNRLIPACAGTTFLFRADG